MPSDTMKTKLRLPPEGDEPDFLPSATEESETAAGEVDKCWVELLCWITTARTITTAVATRAQVKSASSRHRDLGAAFSLSRSSRRSGDWSSEANNGLRSGDGACCEGYPHPRLTFQNLSL